MLIGLYPFVLVINTPPRHIEYHHYPNCTFELQTNSLKPGKHVHGYCICIGYSQSQRPIISQYFFLAGADFFEMQRCRAGVMAMKKTTQSKKRKKKVDNNIRVLLLLGEVPCHSQ